MKVTSLKDLEAYIYWNVIVRLKQLRLDIPNQASPMSIQGRSLELAVNRSFSTREYQHNYQRREAEASASWLVQITDGRNLDIVAEYETARHTVRIYAGGFERFENPKLLQNKLEESFGKYAPFTKVTVVAGRRTGGLETTEAPSHELRGVSYSMAPAWGESDSSEDEALPF